ncbi:MAG: type II toxin-antitoxin system RelE/ParE family toxin [bacterium]
MKPVELFAEAEAEIGEIVDWYAERSPAAAARFIDDLQHVLSRIPERPLAFPVITHTTTELAIRRARCADFPYGVIYAERDESILVVAVVHLKRRPLYWIERLGQVQ